MRRLTLVAIIPLLIGSAALATSGARAPSAVDPDDFVRHVTNPFLPLQPGTVFVYRGTSGGEGFTDRVRVMHRTRTILGIRATVVRDVVRHGATVLESTADWFAQNRAGNVWYFGERTRSYEDGRVSTEGSWEAGVDGAQPGIVMPADPEAAAGYRQEHSEDEAEDQAWILHRGGSIRRWDHVLATLEWTPLEPKVFERKWYARGIGFVRSVAVAGEQEVLELVSVHRPD